VTAFGIKFFVKTLGFQVGFGVLTTEDEEVYLPGYNACSLVKIVGSFGGIYRLHLQGRRRRKKPAGNKQQLPEDGIIKDLTLTPMEYQTT
jgi:hypothetical protein